LWEKTTVVYTILQLAEAVAKLAPRRLVRDHATILLCHLDDWGSEQLGGTIPQLPYLVGGIPTPLKNDGVRQLG
jgi:hypothetical protein